MLVRLPEVFFRFRGVSVNIRGGRKFSFFSIVHEAFCRIDDFDILNGELVNSSFDHDTSLKYVRFPFDLYELLS